MYPCMSSTRHPTLCAAAAAAADTAHHPDTRCVLTAADTLVARFNLVCADAWKIQLTNSVSVLTQHGSLVLGPAVGR